MNVTLLAAQWRWKGFLKQGSSTAGDLPAKAVSYLSRDNPYLQELKSRYARMTDLPHSFWAPWEQKVNLHKFRGESDYLSQAYFRKTAARYELTYAYVEATDDLALLNLLTEDRLFGVKAWQFIPGKLATRDLMDSILEISFLQKALGFGRKDCLRVLDIGAGYGRFAHRLTISFPNIMVNCIDPVATSTFLSDFYLKFRGCNGTQVLPFDKLGEIRPGSFNVAANIHSWSECTKEFITFWLDRLCDMNIPYLFHVPHTATLATVEADGSSLTYDDELERHGFKEVLKQRKFHRSKWVDAVGLFPADYRLYKRGTMQQASPNG